MRAFNPQRERLTKLKLSYAYYMRIPWSGVRVPSVVTSADSCVRVHQHHLIRPDFAIHPEPTECQAASFLASFETLSMQSSEASIASRLSLTSAVADIDRRETRLNCRLVAKMRWQRTTGVTCSVIHCAVALVCSSSSAVPAITGDSAKSKVRRLGGLYTFCGTLPTSGHFRAKIFTTCLQCLLGAIFTHCSTDHQLHKLSNNFHPKARVRNVSHLSLSRCQ